MREKWNRSTRQCIAGAHVVRGNDSWVISKLAQSGIVLLTLLMFLPSFGMAQGPKPLSLNGAVQLSHSNSAFKGSSVCLENELLPVDPCDPIASGNPDSDGDGVSDVCDLDDDNDGILDADEGHVDASPVPSSVISATEASWTDMNISMTAGNFYEFTAVSSSFGPITASGGPYNGQQLLLMQYAHTARTDLDGNRYSLTGTYWNTPVPPINIAWANLTSTDYANELRTIGLIDVNGNGTFDAGTDELIDPLLQVNGAVVIQASVSGDFHAIYADAGVNVGNAGEMTFSVYEYSLRDSDADGIPDHVDLDSDNDGIHDALEAGHGQAHLNGVVSGAVDAFGIPSSVSDGVGGVNYTLVNSDGAGKADPYSLDSDNDGCSDVLEAGFTDDNSDGLLGDVPLTVDSDGLVTSGSDGYTGTTGFVTNALQQAGCPDNDNDLISDYNDLDDDNDGILDDAENQCVIFESFEGNSVSGATAPDFYLSDYYQNNPLPANLLPIRSPDYAVNGNVPPASNWFAPIEGGGFLALQANSNANEIGFSASDPQLVANDGIYINYSAAELHLLGVSIGDTVKLSFFTAPGHNWDTEVSLTDPTLRNSDDDTRLKLWYGSTGGGLSFPVPDDPAVLLSMPPDQDVIPGAWNPVSNTGDDVMDGTSWLKVEDDFLYEGGELIFAMLAGKGPTNASGESETVFLDDFRICVLVDTDNDGVLNQFDLDSDNDGIYDAVEAGHAQSHTNGVLNGGVDVFGIPLSVSTGSGGVNYTFSDSDNDGNLDANDWDSDDDGCADVLEAGFTDDDLDGVLGDDPVNVDSDGLVTSGTDGYTGTTAFVTNALQQAGCPDNDNDLISDHNDLDDDNDGLLDSEECSLNFVNISSADLGLGQGEIDATVTNVDVSSVMGLPSGSVSISAEHVYTQSAGTALLQTASDYEPNIPKFTVSGTVPVYVRIRHGQQIPAPGEEDGFTSLDGVPFTFDGNLNPGFTLNSVGNDYYVKRTTGGISAGTIQWTSNGENVGSFEVWTTYSNTSPSNFFLYIAVCADTDSDGISNKLDLDSDNDGIHDLLEAGHAESDTDQDGVIDGPTSAFGANGLFNALETVIDNGVLNYTVADTDGDGDFDPVDSDSDSDGCNDVLEGGFTDDNFDGLLGDVPLTVDSDGLVTSGSDGYTGTTGFVTNAAQQSGCPDNDNDLVSDQNDLDDDNDGILDSPECNGTWVMDGDHTVNGLSVSNASTTTSDGLDFNLSMNGTATIDVAYPPSFINAGFGNIVPAFDNTQSHFRCFYNGKFGLHPQGELTIDFPEYVESVQIKFSDMAHGSFSSMTSLRVKSPEIQLDLLQTDGKLYVDGRTVSASAGGGTHGTGIVEYTGFFNQLKFDLGFDHSSQMDATSRFYLNVRYRSCSDTDSDTVPDQIDLDSDNDGVYDVWEAGHGQIQTNGLVNSGVDIYGIPLLVSDGSGGVTYTYADSDGNGTLDAYQLDSDMDGCFDVIEAGYTDANNDGMLGTTPVIVDSNGLVIQ